MVTIRNAGPDDAEALEGVRTLGWRAAYEGLLPVEVIAAATGPDAPGRLRELLRADPARSALLAEDGGRAVGMAVYGPDRAPGGDAELYALYVLPEYWSTGLGRRLMDRVLADLRARGHRRISITVLAGNDRARRFYERYGFVVAEHMTNERHGHPTDELRYERELERP